MLYNWRSSHRFLLFETLKENSCMITRARVGYFWWILPSLLSRLTIACHRFNKWFNTSSLALRSRLPQISSITIVVIAEYLETMLKQIGNWYAKFMYSRLNKWMLKIDALKSKGNSNRKGNKVKDFPWTAWTKESRRENLLCVEVRLECIKSKQKRVWHGTLHC